ncbi:hypothetical protein A3A84_01655 [Candidatus Collierbacteria bacterium RIFCSPLOWO2_01_FULL_50_23]|uniref:Uncharacterized protein n=2 Tax=Candidatus Collieribacteriota TaxID=1752725 RepID=A0A1F5EX45_9BACT|nr:MAG: hypothetical protein A3D09_03700 [Candidatus Collierbacteria bacterium RIFCSPHIGHO2_02_FULL_49_10]OGD72368.1 MAG: hypothetical protein A2703_02270 [Candidatus Collierbacteria bacterium RIFCSPHIGHO2_01_FULL_50_25]OGD73944.1 MAG: hypothetical protein A3A84_01655 [Candidatus Collierbacteria bacterium RIFCSPLOWO2_01_FULL_50_23]
MDDILGSLSLSLIVGLFVKGLLVLTTLLSLVTVRQASLMDKVLNVPIGNWFKTLAWGFFFVSLILTIGIVLIV